LAEEVDAANAGRQGRKKSNWDTTRNSPICWPLDGSRLSRARTRSAWTRARPIRV